MAYSLKHTDMHQTSVEINNISGFFVALPFNFDGNQNMVLHPERAVAIARVVMARSPKVAFPTYSQDLPNEGNYELLDENGQTKIALNAFSRTHVISSQASDLAQSLWLFKGDQSEDCQIITINPFKSKPPFHMKGPQHYSWAGMLKDKEDTPLLQSCYTEFNLDVSKNNLIKSMMTFGPAGSHGGMPLMTWLTEQGSWLKNDNNENARPMGINALDSFTIHDDRRKTKLDFFGTSDEGKSQSDNSEGVVFLLQGGMNHLQPHELAKLIRESTTGQDGLDKLADFDALNIISKTCSETAREHSKEVLNKDDTVFEGISLWNLNSRRDNADEVESSEAIFL